MGLLKTILRLPYRTLEYVFTNLGHSPFNNKNLMNKLYCNQTGRHNLPATVSSLSNNIPGIKEMKGLIKVDIINLNLKIKYENREKLSW